MSTENTTETAGQRRLREAREQAAALDTPAASADASAALRLPVPGEQVHCLVSGTTIATGGVYGGVVLHRGQTITITADLLEAQRDRHGNYGGPALVHDELAQFERYGDVLFRAGAAPKDLESWTYGSPDWAEARERARREAHALPTEQARAEALAAVLERFGAPPVTSTTLNSAPNASIRAAEEQQAKIRAAGVRSFQYVEAKEAGAER